MATPAVPPVTPNVADSRYSVSLLLALTMTSFSACTRALPPSRMALTCFSKEMVTTVAPSAAVLPPDAESAPPKLTARVSPSASTAISPSPSESSALPSPSASVPSAALTPAETAVFSPTWAITLLRTMSVSTTPVPVATPLPATEPPTAAR